MNTSPPHKILFATALLFPLFLAAHNSNLLMERAPAGEVVWFYLKLGVEHIIPGGVDHILFIVALCMLNNKISAILWQATAFTVAHTITLALSMNNVIVVPSQIIETIIALSIVFVAVENIVINTLKPWRILLVFCFGLVHGMGFAAALNEIGLPRNKYVTSLLSFNVGVELGQVVVIVLAFLLFIYPFGKKSWYKTRIVIPVSLAIALIALYWTIQRMVNAGG
jgi:hypothetical protein